MAKAHKQQPKARKRAEPRDKLSLHGLTLEEALKAAMEAGPHPSERIDPDEPAPASKKRQRKG